MQSAQVRITYTLEEHKRETDKERGMRKGRLFYHRKSYIWGSLIFFWYIQSQGSRKISI